MKKELTEVQKILMENEDLENCRLRVVRLPVMAKDLAAGRERVSDMARHAFSMEMAESFMNRDFDVLFPFIKSQPAQVSGRSGNFFLELRPEGITGYMPEDYIEPLVDLIRASKPKLIKEDCEPEILRNIYNLREIDIVDCYQDHMELVDMLIYKAVNKEADMGNTICSVYAQTSLPVTNSYLKGYYLGALEPALIHAEFNALKRNEKILEPIPYRYELSDDAQKELNRLKRRFDRSLRDVR